MKKGKKFIYSILILALALLVSFIFGMYYNKKSSKPEIDSTLIKNRLVMAKELTTLKYHYTNMAQFENQNTFYGYKLPFTSKKFIVSYDGIINAGVNLDKMEVLIKDKSIIIKIPKPSILSHEIDEKSLKVFDERESIFNRIDIKDYNAFSIEQKKKIESKAIENGLLKEAEQTSMSAITSILRIDSLLDNYDISFYFEKDL